MLIDTHCHINDKRLINQHNYIMEELDNYDIASIINVGYDYDSSVERIKLSDIYSKVYASIGIHPHYAKDAKMWQYEEFIKLSSSNKVVAYGEIGLDYYHDFSPRDIQRRELEKQLLLAHELNLPVIIHLRDAYMDMTEILFSNRDYIKNGLLFHCYSGSVEMIKKYNELDAYYALGGAITYGKKADVIKAIPSDRLLLETDCPYMTPVPHRGKVNYPHYIRLVLEHIAYVTGEDKSIIEERIYDNTLRLFTKLNKCT